MMIVSSNSLTVSNVNDGTITHLAYSWSADGTDRFMTSYPGENLWSDKKAVSYYIAGGTGLLTKSNAPDAAMIDPVTVPSTATKLVLTIYNPNKVVNTVNNAKPSFFKGDNYLGYQSTFQLTGYMVQKEEWSIPAGATKAYLNTLLGAEKAESFDFSIKTKYEFDTATPYTPAPLDDPEGAYPKFIGTYTDYIADDSTDPSKYTWAKLRGEQGPKGDSGADGKPGKDGVGLKSTVVMYQLGSSGTTKPTGTWSATVPTLTKGQYLWTKTTWIYSDSSSEDGFSVAYIAKDGNSGKDGIAGKDGTGIKSTVIEYAVSSNGVTKPSTGWSATITSVAPGQFMWTRTTWLYTDGTNEVGYSVAQAGKTGAKGDTGSPGKDGIAGKDGVGIKSTTVTYQASSNGTTAPIGAWTANVPSTTKGQYLWTRTVWTYTDNTTETGYSVSYIAKDGNTGANGVAGKDGVGIKSTTITYANSKSGTTAPTSGWTANPPATSAGQYLWTKTVWSYTDGTNETGYSVGKIGEKGDKGDSGADGKPGKDGVGIKSTLIQYASNTSGTVAPTTGWATTIPAASPGHYVWTKYTWTYTDGTTETGYSVGKIGETGQTGKKGDTGPRGSTGAKGATGPQGPQGPKGDPGSKDVPVITSGTSFPSTRKTGDMHWKTDSSGKVIGYYKFNGSQWVVQKVDAQALNVPSLSALSANLGTVTAGTINGVNINGAEFHESFNNAVIASLGESVITSSGEMIINDGMFTVKGDTRYDDGVPSGQKYETSIRPGAFNSSVTITDGVTVGASAYISFGNLLMRNLVSGRGADAKYTFGMLKAEDLSQLNNVGQLLWSGNAVMNATQTITPTTPMSECLNGWVLLWSELVNGATAVNSRFFFQYIPKWFAGEYNGNGVTMVIDAPESTKNSAHLATKYLYISNDSFKGYAGNTPGNGAGYTLREVRAW